MSLWQARRAVVTNLTAPGMSSHFVADRDTIRFTLDSIELDGRRHGKNAEHFKIDLKTLEPISAVYGRMSGISRLKDGAGRDLPPPLNYVELRPDTAGVVISLASALNRLREFTGNAGDPLRTFTQRAAAWRALPSKPAVSEEVRVQRLLAEDAVKQNKPGQALNCYETGLEIYPTWPQGRFNAALIAAELGYYAEAIEHMQAYLELVPDAPDAQSARDQIAIWQYKAKGAR
jgi:tetratricopeptide (TPR) repeat protein